MKTILTFVLVCGALPWLAGCRGGPAIQFALDLNQGPRLQVVFGATPVATDNPTNKPALKP